MLCRIKLKAMFFVFLFLSCVKEGITMTLQQEKEREALLHLWTKSWTEKNNLGIEKIFAPNIHYIRSWGPEYRGLLELQYWFSEKNDRATVTKWIIKEFIHEGNMIVVHWYAEEKKEKGKVAHLEGMSLVRWNDANKIEYVQRFASNMNRFDPYKTTETPNYTDEQLKDYKRLHD